MPEASKSISARALRRNVDSRDRRRGGRGLTLLAGELAIAGVLSSAMLLILAALILASCAAPQPVQPARKAAQSFHHKTKPGTTKPQVDAASWCETFGYVERSTAWDQCLARWKRNLAERQP